MVFKTEDSSSIMAAGRLHMTRNMTRIYKWQDTQRTQAQSPVTFISLFNIRLLLCKSSVDYLFILIDSTVGRMRLVKLCIE